MTQIIETNGFTLFQDSEKPKESKGAVARIVVEASDGPLIQIIRDALESGKLHFQHRETSLDKDDLPAWASEVYRFLKEIENGTFHFHFDPAYLQQNRTPWDINSRLPYPDVLRDLVLRGVQNVVDMSESDRAWHPRNMADWFVSKAPGKPSTSGFLRSLRTNWQEERLAARLDRDGKDIAYIHARLPTSSVDALEAIYQSATDSPIRPLTFWAQCLKLWEYLETYGAGLRNQFAGAYRGLCDTMGLVGAVKHLRAWRRSEGYWSGFFPAPMDSDWDTATEWVAMERGVYLYLLEPEKPGRWRPGTSGTGREVVEDDWKNDFLDPIP